MATVRSRFWSADDEELEQLMNRLGEAMLELHESQALADVREAGEDPTLLARRTRAFLWAEAKAVRQRPLREAVEAYQRELSSIRAQSHVLPVSPQGRRELMESMFERFPQMHSAFL